MLMVAELTELTRWNHRCPFHGIHEHRIPVPDVADDQCARHELHRRRFRRSDASVDHILFLPQVRWDVLVHRTCRQRFEKERVSRGVI